MKIRHIFILISIFILGVIVGSFSSYKLAARDHAREETKMAYVNLRTAIEDDDKEMQRYFEEVITWNAAIYLSPRFFEGQYSAEMKWLDDEATDCRYTRMKGGFTYSELLDLAEDRINTP